MGKPNAKVRWTKETESILMDFTGADLSRIPNKEDIKVFSSMMKKKYNWQPSESAIKKHVYEMRKAAKLKADKAITINELRKFEIPIEPKQERTSIEAINHIFLGVVNAGTVCPFCESTMRVIRSNIDDNQDTLGIDFICDACKNMLEVNFMANP